MNNDGNDKKIVDELLKNNVVSFEQAFKKKVESNQEIKGNNNQQVYTPSTNTPPTHVNQSIIGDGNIQATGNVTINTTGITKKVINKVTPTEEHITNTQARQIQTLVAEIVKLEKQVKDKPRGYEAVWNSFKNRFKCTSYLLLERDKLPEALSYLRQTIGRLDKTSKAKESPDWRKRKYAYIHTNSKKYKLESKRLAYMTRRFGVTSLTELSDDELNQMYNWVAASKKGR